MKKFLILPPILALIVLIWLPGREKTNGKTKTPSEITTSLTTEPTLTDTDLHDFWDKHMDKQIQAVVARKYKFPEINTRYDVLLKNIVARYGKMYVVSKSTVFCSASKSVLEGTIFENGQPTVVFFVPAIARIYPDFAKRYGSEKGEEVFEITTVVGFLHELDHLANGTTGFSARTDVSLEELSANEALTWSETCEMTMKPLLDRGDVILGDSHLSYYEWWLLSGRDAKSPRWKKFIRDAYSITR